MQILKRHFDRAVKQHWCTDTCLIAQCAIEFLPSIAVSDAIDDIIATHSRAAAAMNIFDWNFDRPGDEKKKVLQKLRASLPITIR